MAVQNTYSRQYFQFEPYVTKYAFYPSYQCPPEGERFGYAKMQLTEHHWLVSDLDPRLGIKAIAETFPMDVLVWQGNLLRLHLQAAVCCTGEDGGDIGNEARQTAVEGANPFIFAFLLCGGKWTSKVKAEQSKMVLTIVGTGNRFPEGVDKAEGEKWLFEEVIPVFEKAQK